MVKMRGAEFATPHGNGDLGRRRSIRPARTEKIAVAAARHGEAGARQADDRVAEGRGLPGFGGETAWAEESFGDGAVAGAGEPSVERAKGEDQTIERDEAGLAVFGRPCAM